MKMFTWPDRSSVTPDSSRYSDNITANAWYIIRFGFWPQIMGQMSHMSIIGVAEAVNSMKSQTRTATRSEPQFVSLYFIPTGNETSCQTDDSSYIISKTDLTRSKHNVCIYNLFKSGFAQCYVSLFCTLCVSVFISCQYASAPLIEKQNVCIIVPAEWRASYSALFRHQFLFSYVILNFPHWMLPLLTGRIHPITPQCWLLRFVRGMIFICKQTAVLDRIPARVRPECCY